MAILKPIENGNMYPGWWRWNPQGGCLHGCSYCYMKAMGKRCGKDMMTPVFREDYLKDDLGSERKIFVCSSGDMWGEWVRSEHIRAVLAYCSEYPDNEYMFLTKNPGRYCAFFENGEFPDNSILGATIETNLDNVARPYSSAICPTARGRLAWMTEIRERYWSNVTTMISIEPVMKFDKDFSVDIYYAGPDIVYIGADTGRNGLLEPSAVELQGLIYELREAGIEVHEKKNLARLKGGKPSLIDAAKAVIRW